MLDIVNQVSQTRYAAFLNDKMYAHSGESRYAGTGGSQHDAARNNILSAFASYGLSTELEPFKYGAATYYNIVATLPGTIHSDEVYIAGAHFDSVSSSCPGANDNGSGVASIVEAARVLSQHRFGATLKFIAFDCEEHSHAGGYAYVSAHAGDDIRGMISADMIGYDAAGPNHGTVNVYYGNTNPPAITTALSNAITQFGNGVVAVPTKGTAMSDDYPFYLGGIDATLALEHDYISDPNFHKTTDSVDTPDYVDYAYATNITRGLVGCLASEAIALPEPASIVLLMTGVLALVAHGRRRLASLVAQRDCNRRIGNHD